LQLQRVGGVGLGMLQPACEADIASGEAADVGDSGAPSQQSRRRQGREVPAAEATRW
jgi:hypothetical protein